MLGEFNQCGVNRTSAQSHFSISWPKRNQHCAAGGGSKTAHHHVFQPKPTIHRVRHALGKAKRARANVQDKENVSETSIHYSSEDSEEQRVSEWLPKPQHFLYEGDSSEYSIHALVKEPHGARVGGAGASYISWSK